MNIRKVHVDERQGSWVELAPSSERGSFQAIVEEDPGRELQLWGRTIALGSIALEDARRLTDGDETALDSYVRADPEEPGLFHVRPGSGSLHLGEDIFDEAGGHGDVRSGILADGQFTEVEPRAVDA